MVLIVLLYYIHIGVGSTLLVLIGWAMREPLNVEQVTDKDSTLFYFYQIYLESRKSKVCLVLAYHENMFVENLKVAPGTDLGIEL